MDNSVQYYYKIKYYISAYFSCINYKKQKLINGQGKAVVVVVIQQVLLDKESAIVHTADNTYGLPATFDVYKNVLSHLPDTRGVTYHDENKIIGMLNRKIVERKKNYENGMCIQS